MGNKNQTQKLEFSGILKRNGHSEPIVTFLQGGKFTWELTSQSKGEDVLSFRFSTTVHASESDTGRKHRISRYDPASILIPVNVVRKSSFSVKLWHNELGRKSYLSVSRRGKDKRPIHWQLKITHNPDEEWISW